MNLECGDFLEFFGYCEGWWGMWVGEEVIENESWYLLSIYFGKYLDNLYIIYS